MSYWNMTARGNLSSVYSITDNTRCKSRTVTTPSGPLEVPELSCEPGRQKQKRLGLFLSLRRRYKLKSVMAKYAFNSFIKQLSLKRSNTTSLLLFFLSSHQENVSFYARQGAQSGPLPAVLYRDGRHARGLQTLQVSADFFFILVVVVFSFYLHALSSTQVCVPQLAVDGGWKHGSLLHLAAALRAPGLPVRRRDVDASGHQLWPSQAHQQRDGR